MTPQEFIYNFIEQLQKTEVEKPPEMVEYISALQTIADSDDKEAHERAMQNLLELGKKLVPAEQIEQKTVLPLAPDPDMAGTSPNYPIGKKENSTWVEIKRIAGIIRQEYPKYKAPAMLGLQVGVIIVGVLWIISLYYAWGGVGTFDNSTTNDFRFLKFFHLDTLFVSLVIFRWALFTIIILSALTYFADELDTVKIFYRRFLVDAVIIFVVVRFIFGSPWTASNNLYL